MLDLEVLPGDYAICRLPAGSPLPSGLDPGSGVVSVTWTPYEVSVICPRDQAPAEATLETPWRCLRVAGLVELTLTGVLNSLTGPLAEARVNVFAFSTFDTDYLLVPAVRLAEAIAALSAAGHRLAA
ncbi:ACT domain-containing protein [Rugosimonospora acidiphila]|uniref:ACT domain-containing protein n=1 Tax=Rugosimonospora acidiphila TaxID=556531 RepID=A0ABP9S1L8_9ACTN